MGIGESGDPFNPLLFEGVFMLKRYSLIHV